MSHYPERLSAASSEPLSKFVFTTALIPDAKRENELELEALRERINRLNKKCTIAEMTVIDKILSVSHDVEEIRALAKGLERVAQIIERHDKLEEREHVFNVAESDLGWFGSAFGDFADDLDKIHEFSFDKDMT